MKLPNLANVIDLEMDGPLLVEIGVTVVDIKRLEIIRNFNVVLSQEVSLSPAFIQLTGWTDQKVAKQGLTTLEAIRRLDKHGIANRLLVTDTSTEIDFLKNYINANLNYGIAFKPSDHRLNVSILFKLLTGEPTNLGLDKMLEYFDMKFEGHQHRALADSYNIARLFLRMLEECRGLL